MMSASHLLDNDRLTAMSKSPNTQVQHISKDTVRAGILVTAVLADILTPASSSSRLHPTHDNMC